MKWKTRILILLGVSVIAVTAFAFFRTPAGPFHAGHSLQHWLKTLHADEITDREQAVLALREIGAPALPALMDDLQQQSSWAEKSYLWLYPRLPERLSAQLPKWVPAHQRRAQAAYTLEKLGPISAPASAALAIALTDRDTAVANLARYALTAIGKEAVPTLVQELRSTDPQRREAALQILRALGPVAEAAAPVLRTRLQVKDFSEQMLTAEALWDITHSEADIIPVCQSVLAAQADRWRHRAADLLAEIGPAAKGALPTLESALIDQDPYLQLRAAEAWWKISGDTNRAVTVFCRGMRHNDGNVRWNAVMAIGRVTANAAEAVPLLAERLQKDPDKFVRTVCADVLGRMGEAARPAIPALLVAVLDDDYLVQTSSARALGILDPSLGIQAATE